MKRFVVFPNLTVSPAQRPNPYIQDYIEALNRLPDVRVINPAHKNPLLSLLPPSRWGDVFIFNWFESIPDFKYGPLQAVTATAFLLLQRIRGKKIVWMLHNKKPHAQGRDGMKTFLARLIAKNSSIIITHSEEGVRLVHDDFPYAANKVHYIDHPTKCRLPLATAASTAEKKYDLLIWGTIARYKGIFEFVDYIRTNKIDHLRICIVGGASEAVFNDLKAICPDNVTLINQRPSFDELADYINQSEFVLCPYAPETILSSGMLMDSLSFGAKVIGPEVGSFKDYAGNSLLNVYTFKSFDDIDGIVQQHKHDSVSLANYRKFLEENDWTHYAQKLAKLLGI